MKNTKFGRWIAVLALMGTSAGIAGETYTEPVMPPPAEPNVWTWFIGGSAVFVDDWEDELWAFQIGAEKVCGVTSHALFLEVGWAGDDGDDRWRDDDFERYLDWDIDLVPVTLNYKMERPLFNSERLNWYIGAGAGVLFTDADWKTSFDDDGGRVRDDKGSHSDERFFGQVFAGLTWNLSERFEVFGGGRWLYLDTPSDYDIDDNTVAGELGIRFNF